MSGVIKEKKGMYYAYFYDAKLQKPVWRATGIKAVRGNKRKAEQKKDEIMRRYFDEPHEKIPFVEYLERWLDTVKNKVDAITYEGYRQYTMSHIIPYFQPLNLNLQDVRLSHIEDYYRFKAKAGRLDGKPGGLSYRSIKLHSVVLNLAFTDAVHDGRIKGNPCQYAKIPKEAKRSEKLTDFYTPKQCQELLNITEGTPLHDMIYVTFIYGLRRSEMMGLKWDAVDFEAETVKIRHTVSVNGLVVSKDSTKNESSKRTYPLLYDIKEIFEKLKNEQDENRRFFGNSYIDTGYVFTKPDGSTYYPSYPTHTLEKVLKKHNLPHIRWHDLRHSCASMLIEKGWQMKDISEWLGHSDIGTTMNIYGHISMEHKKTLGKSLTGILNE